MKISLISNVKHTNQSDTSYRYVQVERVRQTRLVFRVRSNPEEDSDKVESEESSECMEYEVDHEKYNVDTKRRWTRH